MANEVKFKALVLFLVKHEKGFFYIFLRRQCLAHWNSLEARRLWFSMWFSFSSRFYWIDDSSAGKKSRNFVRLICESWTRKIHANWDLEISGDALKLIRDVSFMKFELADDKNLPWQLSLCSHTSKWRQYSNLMRNFRINFCDYYQIEIGSSPALLTIEIF